MFTAAVGEQKKGDALLLQESQRVGGTGYRFRGAEENTIDAASCEKRIEWVAFD